MMRSILTILFVCATSSAVAAPSIRVPAQAAISGPVVLLGDVAAIRGVPRTERKRYAAISLGRAPAIGVTKYIPRAFIESRIKDGGVAKTVRLRLPLRLHVQRRSRVIDRQELDGAIRTAVQSAMPHALDEVARVRIPRLPELKVPEKARVKVAFREGEDFRGAVTVELIIVDGGERVLTRRVSVTVDLYVTAWGVKREMRRGGRLSVDDLMELRLPQSEVARDAIREPAFVDGATVRRKIEPGEAIREAWFKIPPLVERGERVRLTARRGAIRITAIGEAMNAGANGAFVRVRNMDSRKVVTGRVTGPGAVAMEF